MWNNTFYSWTTGGGFSIGTPMPAPGLFNPKNRAYPDISSAGARFLYLVDDVVTVVEGTSASAPTVAAFVSLLNAYRFKQDKPALGFLNPLLYKLAVSNPTIFNDITVGSNRCTVDGVCCPYGYDSTKGWDAVTGFGSIHFDKFFEVVKQL
jgi:tripeptidyl-peptidase-1